MPLAADSGYSGHVAFKLASVPPNFRMQLVDSNARQADRRPALQPRGSIARAAAGAGRDARASVLATPEPAPAAAPAPKAARLRAFVAADYGFASRIYNEIAPGVGGGNVFDVTGVAARTDGAHGRRKPASYRQLPSHQLLGGGGLHI
jgi:hypothetical protein